MKKKVHIEMTRQALERRFSERALDVLITGNLSQDSLSGLLWHPEHHYDEQIAPAEQHLEELRRQTLSALTQGKPEPAWWSFGRLVHTAQDFYAHTSFVYQWVESHTFQPVDGNAASLPHVDSIEPLAPWMPTQEILDMPGLISWHVDFAWEILGTLPGMSAWVRRNSPPSSHTRMNLDGPESGPLFPFAQAAATKRTRLEFEFMARRIHEASGQVGLALFTGNPRGG